MKLSQSLNNLHSVLGSPALSPLTVTALTSGRSDPSSRFRVRQHLSALSDLGVHVTEIHPSVSVYAPTPLPSFCSLPRSVERVFHGAWFIKRASSRIGGVINSWKTQVTWLQKPLIPGKSTLEFTLKGPVAFDVDDAVWFSRNPKKRRSSPIIMKRILDRSDLMIAGNRYLASWAESQGKAVQVIHTAIDTDRFFPKSRSSHSNQDRKATDRFTVGWTGTASNLEFFSLIEAPLNEFLIRFDAELLIVADRSPNFKLIPEHKVRYVKWTPDNECTALHEMDVGLMPLPENEWTLGKCSFKMLQYMATGLPTIVSPVGLNGDILSYDKCGFGARDEGEWLDALVALRQQPDLAATLGERGRRLAVERFSVPVISSQIASALRSLV